MLTRRAFIASAAATGLAALGARSAQSDVTRTASVTLEAVEADVALAPSRPPTSVFTYNGELPGPALRFRQGEEARIAFTNRLARPTTVHWHGLRVPNAMDGVPGVTQDPVAPGGRFDYGFTLRNPGTYWYHPHFQSAEQLDRGLAGAIIVTGPGEPEVDRDLLWVLDDWRLDADGRLVEDFGQLHDVTHAGRIGNVPTINGRSAGDLEVRANERIRLRLVNVANARIFALEFGGHRPLVIALDGHAVAPHVPSTGRVVLGPSMRVDVILDCSAGAGTFEIRDVAYRRFAYTLTRLKYSGAAGVRTSAPAPFPGLPPPELPVVDLDRATEHALVLAGGAMGGMRAATIAGETVGIRGLVARGKAWAVNGVVADRHDMPPLLTLERGSSHVLAIRNDTSFPHPVHLHGHPLLVLDGVPGSAPLPHWRDTVFVAPRETARVALVADNPGRWLIHCHIPEHQEGGMAGIVEVL